MNEIVYCDYELGGGLRHEGYHVYKINCEPFNAEPLDCSKALRLLFS